MPITCLFDTQSHDCVFLIQHFYSATRRGGPKLWPIDWGVSAGGLVPEEYGVGGV